MLLDNPGKYDMNQTAQQNHTNKNRLSKLMSALNNNKVVVFTVVFAAVGSWLIWSVLGASQLIGSLQAEQMSLPVGASVINDTYASGGQAMMMTAPGESTGVFTLPTNTTSFSVVAKGTKCGKYRWWRKSPSTQSMTISIDGNQILTSPVTSASWTSYSAAVNLAATSHKLTITYANSSASCAQSLYLDVAKFYGETVTVTSAPTVALSASPTALIAGLSANITWTSSNAATCAASGAWSGSKATSGSASTGALNTTSTYNLSCTGAGGTTSASTVVTVSPASGTMPTPTAMGRFGYSVHINRMSDKTAYADFAKNSNAKTVRDDFMWSEIESTKGSFNWTSPDRLMTYTSQRGLDLLAMAGYTPSWARVSGCTTNDKCAPANVTDYANFVTQVAKRYGPEGTFWTANPSLPYRPLKAIEIWNEPNIHFWLPSPDPVKYTTLLKAAYKAIKTVNSDIQVVSAGLAPYGSYGMTSSSRMNPLNYLEKMYQAGASGYMDAVGWHPYNFAQGRTADSMFAYHIASAWSQMDQTTPSARSLMAKYGDSNKKVWATEVGAPTSTNGVNETEQASFAKRSVSYWKSYSWAGNYYWYDLRDDCTDSSNTECRYGALKHDSTPKPALDALRTSFIL